MHKKDSAVSPVIAVILMVAITVILVAVVYVWVSGFSAENEPPRSFAVQSSGMVNGNFSYTVTSASPTLNWSEIEIRLDGIPIQYNAPSGLVFAGQSFHFAATSGAQMTAIDTKANAIMLTLSIR